MPPKGKGKGKGKGKAKAKQAHRNSPASASNPAAGRVFSREVIFNILSRLPVKTLLRFKCVSKQWRTIVSLSAFISVHHSRSPASLLIYAQKPPISAELEGAHPSGHVIVTYAPLNPPSSTVSPIPDFPGSGAVGPDNQLEVIGSTPNGVVCVVQKPYAQKFTLWNPATRSALTIPASGIEPDPDVLFGASPGLGFDPSFNEYKLIRIVRFNQETLPDMAELFNFKTGRWALLDNGDNGVVKFRVVSLICDAVVDGVPYWRGLEDDVDFGPSPKLVWFDVRESVFITEWLAWEMEDRDMRIGEIREGFLGAVVWDQAAEFAEDRILDVWVRRRNNGPWVQTYRVNQRFTVVGRVVGFYADGVVQEIVIGSVEDGEKPRLCWTTLADVAVRDVFSIDGSWSGTCNVVNYRESLARLPTIRFSMI